MSSDYWEPPIRRTNSGRVIDPSSVDFASMEYIVSNECIAEAWKKVRSNKGAPSIRRQHCSVSQVGATEMESSQAAITGGQLHADASAASCQVDIDVAKRVRRGAPFRHSLCVRSGNHAKHRKSTR